MRTNCIRLVCVAILALAAAPAVAGGAPRARSDLIASSGPPASLQLLKVVMVTRHGIRSGTKSPAFLAEHSERTWPRWPVAPGQLTPHGAKAISRLGAWLRLHYASEGLLAANDCPVQGTAVVWADNADKRTRDSGQAIMDGMFPRCGLRAQWLAPGRHDPLFDGSSSNPVDYAAAVKAVRAHGDPDAPAPGYRQAMQQLQGALGLRHACQAQLPACAWMQRPNRVVRKPDGGVAMEGPLHTAATLSEILLLEYVQGFPAGTDRVSAATLYAILPLHTMYARLMRGTRYLAAHNAGALAEEILRALGAKPAARENPTPAASKLLLLLGHDTNLSNLGALLGVEWTLPDEPDPTAPDTTLAFELLRDAADRRYVRVRVYYQTLEQLRGAEVLDAHNPARFVTLAPPGCVAGPAHSLCTLRQFGNLIAGNDGGAAAGGLQ